MFSVIVRVLAGNSHVCFVAFRGKYKLDQSRNRYIARNPVVGDAPAAEPSKYVCWLTDHGDYDEDHTARLFLLATLHPIDRFFMQTRRRVSFAERSAVSSRNERRMWSGYSAYSPAVLQRYLEICRTYYNYCLVGKDDKTPAMRLGLAKAPQTADAILRFS